jgi:purine-binding chemotaxis protein CheW
VTTTTLERQRADVPAGPQLLTLTLARQAVGIPVDAVRDVLGPQELTPVPLAAPEIAGVLNLRGRIVTAINLRVRLGVAGDGGGRNGMNVVIDHQGELYSLLVDAVGDVLEPPAERLEGDVSALNAGWREMATGIYPLGDHLLVVLDVGRVLDFSART